MGRKLWAILMTLIIMLPLLAEASITPGIAYAATSAPTPTSVTNTTAAKMNKSGATAETTATNGAAGSTTSTAATSTSAATGSLQNSAIASESTQADQAAPAAASEQPEAATDQPQVTTKLIFNDSGTSDPIKAYQFRSPVSLRISVTVSGQSTALTGGFLQFTLPKNEFMQPTADQFTADESYMAAAPTIDSDYNNYYVSYQLKQISAGSVVKFPFQVKLTDSQKVGSKPVVTANVYSDATRGTLLSTGTLGVPYTVETYSAFSSKTVTLPASEWDDQTLKTTQTMDISKMLRFSYLSGEANDHGSNDSPYYIKVTLPRDRVTFDAAASPDWQYDATTGIARYQINGYQQLVSSTPTALIVHPILSSQIKNGEALPFHFEAGFVDDVDYTPNDNNAPYTKQDCTYKFVKREAQIVSKISGTFPQFGSGVINIDQQQVDGETAFKETVTPVKFLDWQDGDTATLTSSKFAPDLTTGDMTLNSLRFALDKDAKVSATVQAALQHNTITATTQDGQVIVKHDLQLGETLALPRQVYQSVTISYAQPVVLANEADTNFHLEFMGQLAAQNVTDFRNLVTIDNASSKAKGQYTFNDESVVSEKSTPLQSSANLKLTKSVQAKIDRYSANGFGNGVIATPYNVVSKGNSFLVQTIVGITNPNQLTLQNPRFYLFMPAGVTLDTKNLAEVTNLSDVQVIVNFQGTGKTVVTGIPQNVDFKSTSAQSVIFSVPMVATAGLTTGKYDMESYFTVDNNYYTENSADPAQASNFNVPEIEYYDDYKQIGYHLLDHAARDNRAASMVGSFSYQSASVNSVINQVGLPYGNYVDDLGNTLKVKQDFNYRLQLENEDPDPQTQLDMIDVLPYAGDSHQMPDSTGVYTPRASQFGIQLTKAATVTDSSSSHQDLSSMFDIYYSTDEPQQTTAENLKQTWTTTPTDFSAVRMVRAVLKNGQSLAPYQGINFVLPAIAPEAATALPSATAVNTFVISTDGGKSYLESNDSTVRIHQEQGNLDITKVDADDTDRPLAGAKFKVYQASTKTLVGETGATGASGTTTYYNLPAGDYYVVESQAPTGYQADEKQYPFTIYNDTDRELEITNQRDPSQFGQVTIKYQNLDDKQAAIPNVSEQHLTGLIGSDYDASLSKYQPQIPGYQLATDKSELPTNATGTFSATPQTVVYGYHQEAQVQLHYQDEAGHDVFPTQTLTGLVGSDFDLSTADYQLRLPGYQLNTAKLPAKLTGQFTLAPQSYTYLYDELAQPVTINYVDQQQHLLHTSQAINGIIGTPFQADQATYKLKIAGYQLNEAASSPVEKRSGALTGTAQTVTYVYDKIAEPVTINYVDQQHRLLHTSQAINGIIGAPFQADQATYKLKIAGYQLNEAASSSVDKRSGALTGTAQTVTYVYDEIAQPVTVHYQGRTGQTLRPDQLITGIVGAAYDTQSNQYLPQLAGYQLNDQQSSVQRSGQLSEQPQTVTYVYDQLAQPITVQYLDQQGQVIHEPQVLTGLVGDSYQVLTPQYQLTFAGYQLLTQQLPTNASGYFTPQAQTVTFVYQKQTSTGGGTTVTTPSTVTQPQPPLTSLLPQQQQPSPKRQVVRPGSNEQAVWQQPIVRAGKPQERLPQSGEKIPATPLAKLIGLLLLTGLVISSSIDLNRRNEQNK